MSVFQAMTYGLFTVTDRIRQTDRVRRHTGSDVLHTGTAEAEAYKVVPYDKGDGGGASEGRATI